MMKKVLLITAALILAISCSGSPTDPNGTGDGGLIDNGITDPTTISDFLNKNQGRYYIEETDGNIYVSYRIEGGKIYEDESATEIQGSKTLSDNKLQVEIPGNTSSQYGEDWNPRMLILNFSDSSIQLFQKVIFSKENFSTINGYKVIGTFSGLKKYAGNYYRYQGYNDPTGKEKIEKFYLFTIDNNGNIYITQDMVNQVQCSVSGDELTLDFTQEQITYKFIFQANRVILSLFQNGTEQSVTSKKSDLLTPYKGTYSYNNNEITLTVSEAYANINTIIDGNITAILNGNNLIIYKSSYEMGVLKKEEHKIVFSEDKTKADYTKPDGTGTVTLTKQGA